MRMRRSLLVPLAVVTLAVAGCSKSSSSTSAGGPTGSTGGPTGASGTPANCTDLSQGSVFKLTQQNFAFHPACVIARSEQSILIANQDSVLHNFTITGTQVDVDIQPGTTFNGESAGLAPGSYVFFCKYHQSRGMVGAIVVK
ncbi:MAG: cupredoxin domain-containing protein [Actinomycetota bacterium]|nr:cupredoxin domain-containing protein [Actinomycetota bacterium]